MDPFVDWLLRNPTAPLVLISSVIAYIAFLTTRHLARSKHAIDFETAYHDSPDIRIALGKLSAWSKTASRSDMAQLAQLPSHEMTGHVRELLNTWERVAIAIRRGVYDDLLLYNAYASTLIGIWQLTLPFIRARQLANPRLYVNLDWLAIAWMIRRDSIKEQYNLQRLKAAQAILRSIER